jgi:hypothetical protein
MNLTGIMLRSSIVAGVAFVRTVYCLSSILAVPDGSVRFCVYSVHNVKRSESSRQQLVRIDVDHDLAILAACGRRQGDAGDGSKLLAHTIDTEVVELLLVEPVRAEAELQHGNT